MPDIEDDDSPTRDLSNLSYEQRRSLFVGLYPDLEALKRVWPQLTDRQIACRAYRYRKEGAKVKPLVPMKKWTQDEDALLIAMFPDVAAAAIKLGRSKTCVHARVGRLRNDGRIARTSPKRDVNVCRWSEDERRELAAKGSVRGRSKLAARRQRHKFLPHTFVQIHTPGQELVERIRFSVPQYLPRHIRDDVVSHITVECLEGRVSDKPEGIKKAVGPAITAVYRMHPDRGALVSLDAKLFDDGEATIGDRLNSDRFRF